MAAGKGSLDALTLTAMGRLPKVLPAIKSERKKMPMLPWSSRLALTCSNRPICSRTRIDAAFGNRAPRIERINGADQIVVEADQILSGIGLISNAGARFGTPETISAQGTF